MRFQNVCYGNFQLSTSYYGNYLSATETNYGSYSLLLCLTVGQFNSFLICSIYCRYEEPAWAEHVKDKGDLFYVEPYHEPPSNETSSLEQLHLTEDSSNAKTGKPKNKAVLKKLTSVKNIFSGTKSEKDSNTSTHERNLKNSLGVDGLSDKKMTDKFILKDVHLIVTPPRLRSGVRHDLETLLGIIPGRGKTGKVSAENDSYTGSRIYIKGFVPDGTALQSRELKIGKEK